MSFWQQHGIEEKVISILRDVPDTAEGHHIGRPYLTAYQIAIEFAERHPDILEIRPKSWRFRSICDTLL